MRVAFVPDLMDRSRLNAVSELQIVGRVEAIPEVGAGDVVAVDLSRAGALDAGARAAAQGATVYGFASHVDGDTIRAANAAGVTAMARSAFFGKLAELFA